MQDLNLLHTNKSISLFVKRTARVVMTDEARVLREMREEKQPYLSMRSLGKKMNKSDSYISQIENGRLDVPTGQALEEYLEALGGMAVKSFYERVRRFRADKPPTYRDELLEIAKRANEAQVKQILLLAKTILSTPINF